jgi:DNA-binding NarL/FixJ family response regulator
MKIKVFILGNHEIVCHGIRSLLENTEAEVIGECTNGDEAIERIKFLKPDVVIIDINGSIEEAITNTQHLRDDLAKVKILVLMMEDHEAYLTDMLDAGVQAIVLKNVRSEELLFAIKKVAHDEFYLCTDFAINILAKYKKIKGVQGHVQLHIKLSDREMDVLKLVAEGLTNTEMAHRLFTSVRTIETRRKKLLDKTGTNNTATLIKFAVQNGLVN